ncbi:hypothetical protein [Actinomadura harenae]|uniref:Uncharacterized protein n=1 Tax=Actinomadura harenae TaxID=2483351 RepID=A0A3M2LR96_9ACTN|nr:hypothetical protein [Actinomadura harenae]RMI39400.1 hypothetical protein EBO15_29930 [Actinomadura harenae]
MADIVTLPVPATTTSRFVVAAARLPADLVNLVKEQADGAFGDHLVNRLHTPQLEITNEDATRYRWDPTQIRSVDPEHAGTETLLRTAARIAVITTCAPITDQPRAVQVARSAAYTIARHTGGTVADMVTGHILWAPTSGTIPHLDPVERPRFALGDKWLGDVLPPFRANGRCTAPDPHLDPEGADTCACVRLRTQGLRRFGLPELEIANVACPHDLPALNVLRATAHLLLTDLWSWLATGPSGHTCPLPADLTITGLDFDAYWGTPPRPPHRISPFPIHLTPRTRHLLTVGPPPSHEGTINDWLLSPELPNDMRNTTPPSTALQPPTFTPALAA